MRSTTDETKSLDMKQTKENEAANEPSSTQVHLQPRSQFRSSSKTSKKLSSLKYFLKKHRNSSKSIADLKGAASSFAIPAKRASEVSTLGRQKLERVIHAQHECDNVSDADSTPEMERLTESYANISEKIAADQAHNAGNMDNDASDVSRRSKVLYV